jgi:Arc/MetJ-type ribon-helix-helix transcriptional regulator
MVEKEQRTVVVHARLPLKIDQDLKHLIKEGYYSNVSDALRDAARRLLQDHQHWIHEKKGAARFELKEWKLKSK